MVFIIHYVIWLLKSAHLLSRDTVNMKFQFLFSKTILNIDYMFYHRGQFIFATDIYELNEKSNITIFLIIYKCEKIFFLDKKIWILIFKLLKAYQKYWRQYLISLKKPSCNKLSFFMQWWRKWCSIFLCYLIILQLILW
jgi:hypothetical protein